MQEKENTVVLFPNLSQRLRDKGFHALHNKKFHEALDCLDQLQNYGWQDEHSEFAAVVCLIELQEWKEARQRCYQLLDTSKQLFSDALEMYITILVQLHDYVAIAETAERTLKQHELSKEQTEKLMNLASFAGKMQGNADSSMLDEEEFASVFQGNDIAKQMQMLQLLKQRGVVKAFSFFKEFLQNETQHPYIKSSVVHMLMEYQVDEEVIVEKFGQTVTINPSELSAVTDSPFAKAVLEQLENRAGNENPTMFQAILEYWYQILYLLFPVHPLPMKEQLWGAVLEKLGCDRFFIEADDEEIAKAYGVALEELQTSYAALLDIETAGYLPV
jgi:hypothetical protein